LRALARHFLATPPPLSALSSLALHDALPISTTQQALTDEDPVSPRAELLLPLGLLVGLFAGLGLAILTAVLDTRVHSVRDIKQITAVPVVGRIPHDPTIDSDPLV